MIPPLARRMGGLAASFFLLVSGLPTGGPGPARAAPTELFFSEYIEGSSNNKALEIYNGTGAAVNLATDGYSIQMFFNGSASASLTINLTGSVASGDVHVLAQSSANATILAQADQTNGAGWFNGDDAIVLRKGTTIVDAVGQIGIDPGTEWGTGLTSTADNTLRRKAPISAGDTNGSDAFDPAGEWDGFATDSFDGLGTHTFTPPPPAAPVINEFSASTVGTDVEYAEIFGDPNTSYAAYTILEIEGDAGTAAGTIDEVTPLGTTDANGLHLVNLAANALENGTITLLLVKGFTGAPGTDLDTNSDGALDSTPWDAIVDAVTVNDGGAGDLTYSVPTLGVSYDGLPFAPGGASRIPDGLDTDTASDWVRNDFDLAGIPGFIGTLQAGEAVNTPGAPNSTVVPEVAPYVVSTTPGSGAVDVAVDSNLTVTFSEPVNTSDPWFSISCPVGGTVTAVASGGPTTFTLNPAANFVVSDACTVTVLAAAVTDEDTSDPPDAMAANYAWSFTTAAVDPCTLPFTPIYAIQGSGAAAAVTGAITTQGVVVGDYEGPSPTLRGFYLQDLVGDGNLATSDGIFVFNADRNQVALGDVIRVAGSASEFQGQTQVSASGIAACGPGTVAPTDITFPLAAPDFLEQYEGMLVRLPQTMYVTEHFQLGRFGQVVLSSGGRLQQPTNVVSPGAAALALQEANNRRKIILDDASQAQNPDPILFARGGLPLSASNTLRGGDTATGIVGVLNYTWAGNSASGNAYRVRPINALDGYVNFEPTNPRPTSPPDVGGTVQVAGMNLLNYFNTFDGLPDTVDNCANGVAGAPTDCRGADTQAEFGRQYPKTVAGILGTGADVLGLVELENDGYEPTSSIATLVDQLNATTAPGTWAFVDVDAATGQVNALGIDAIKVGMIYKTGVVTPVGTTAVLNSVAFVNGGDAQLRGRPSLAQAFELNTTGGRFIVDVNHFKSKGSACDVPDAGDGQGNCNVVRVNEATELASWLATDPTGSGDPDVLLVGDYNSYAKEDPITVLSGAGFADLLAAFVGPDAYSYVFDGQWGYLTQALGSASLVTQVTGVAEHHVNADEPSVLDYNTDFKTANLITTLYAPNEFRTSDHDPVVVGLSPVNYPPALGDITVTPNPVALGTAVNASVSFTDPDKLDTHTATWDWGDGTTSAGTVTEAAGSGTITGSHTYAAQGVYTVQVAVDDGHGNTDSATFEFVVVYDPNGPFVTGGGWFTSPGGSASGAPGASGRTFIGFVSRYLPGSTVPSGVVRLAFHAAGIDFRSTSIDWMVVTGTPATARIRGAGTVNGEPGYTFELRATDDRKADRVAITIWKAGSVFYSVGDRPLQGSVSIKKAK